MKRIIDFDSTPNTFRGPIVDWCKSLRISTVCEIRLLSSSRAPHPTPLSVVVLLQDGSMYRLQRTVKWVKKQILPNIQDTIEKVSALDIELVSQPLVAINFKQDYRPSLLSLLQICHGIQKHGLIFKAPHVVMDCSDDFFALALVLNATRSCLPKRALADTSGQDCGLLEELWQDIYQLLQRQGHAFWEHTIADHTKSLARELIYRLARHKVFGLLGNRLDEATGLSVAASATARIEALLENKELADPTVWDKAWETRWKEVWKRHGPVAHPRNSGGIQTITSITGGLTTISPAVDGCAPGRLAGRTPVKISPAEYSSVLLNAVWNGPKGPLPGVAINNHATTTSVAEDGSQTRHLAEIASSNIYGIPVADRYDCTVNWLGNSYLSLDSNSYQVWATPRESAIEFAWAAAWSEAETRGKDAAKNLLEIKESENSPPGQATETNARPRKHSTAHPGVLGAISASKAMARLAARASRRLSTSLNIGHHDVETSAVAVGGTGNPKEKTGRVVPSIQIPSGTVPPTPTTRSPATVGFRNSVPSRIISMNLTSSPISATRTHFGNGGLSPVSPRSRKISGASSKQRKSSVPEVSLHPISEASSRVDLSTQVQETAAPSTQPAESASKPFPGDDPRESQAPSQEDSESSNLPSGIEFPRRRSESATKRLRRQVITRWSDPQPYSQFEEDFVNKAQERKYREKKESARAQAAKIIENPAAFGEKLQKADPEKRAEEAWEQAISLSGKDNFEHKLEGLAQQEWEKLLEQHPKASLSLEDRPKNWQTDFVSTWDRAWKESWAAAWKAVWMLSYKEAASRGIEFGTEEILDGAPKLGRMTFKQLQSSEPYRKLEESLLNNKSPLGSLEQVHKWMKELGYLSESLQYSVPSLRDECMDITVIKDAKIKTPHPLMERLGVAEPKSEPTGIRMTHYELQSWLRDDYILRKVKRDKQVHTLFLRGVAEVWDAMSEMD